jgi:putative DNA primase/helicase
LPDILDAALDYAERCGFAVFPVHGARAGRCTCGKPGCTGKDRGKHPLMTGSFKNATTDPAQIRAWRQQWPWANVAIATGTVRLLLVIDIDSADGERALQALEAVHGPLPETLCARSGRGRHLYFKLPADCGSVPGSAGKLGPDIDTRADGGYIIAPPSVHASGARYEFIGEFDPARIAPAPAWLLALLTEQRTAHQAEEPEQGQQRAETRSEAGAGAEARKPQLLPDNFLDQTVYGPFATAWTPLPPKDDPVFAHGQRINVDELEVSDRLKKLIKEGKPKGQRSQAIRSVLLGLRAAGYGKNLICAVLRDPANRISEKPLERSLDWLRKEIDRADAHLAANAGGGAGDKPAASAGGGGASPGAEPHPADEPEPTEEGRQEGAHEHTDEGAPHAADGPEPEPTEEGRQEDAHEHTDEGAPHAADGPEPEPTEEGRQEDAHEPGHEQHTEEGAKGAAEEGQNQGTAGQSEKSSTAGAAPLELDPQAPLAIARLFVAQKHMRGEQRTLHHQGGDFYAWNGQHYQRVELQAVRSAIYAFLAVAVKRVGKWLVPFQPTTLRVNQVVDALAATCYLPNHQWAPIWLAAAADQPPAAELISCANGLLHLPTGLLLPSTPAFFALNAVDFAFDPAAPPPKAWLVFLDALWRHDPEAIATLREWFGYLLTGDTSQQKVLLIVGPKRSGKGTIARVLRDLLGKQNTCAPTLASLAQQFGLAPLIGKQLALISDARLGSRADQQIIAERLLSISGEDAQTIDQKYREPWTGQLDVRFTITTNELPRIADASGALPSRFLVLLLRHSFYGREDPGLTHRLLQELPGILNWSIEGWRTLQERGHFLQPTTSAGAIRDLEDLASPVGAFVRDCCEVGPELTVACDVLFQHWRAWCGVQGRDYPGTAATFGRDLRAAVPGVEVERPRGEGGNRERCYRGIGLRAGAQNGTAEVFPG